MLGARDLWRSALFFLFVCDWINYFVATIIWHNWCHVFAFFESGHFAQDWNYNFLAGWHGWCHVFVFFDSGHFAQDWNYNFVAVYSLTWSLSSVRVCQGKTTLFNNLFFQRNIFLTTTYDFPASSKGNDDEIMVESGNREFFYSLVFLGGNSTLSG